MKQIISITDITSYLYCPRKVYLKKIKKIKEKPTKQMISGMLKHKVFDIFNKNESYIVSSINEKISKEQIIELYKACLIKITNETARNYENMMKIFGIEREELLNSILKFMKKEILLRVSSVKETIDKGFLGKELWRSLKPKYLTEYEILSENLALKGRVDRIRFEDDILPYELKTREEIYESDKIQLAAYSLLLEQEFGKKIEKGIIESANAEEEILITEQMKARVLEIAEIIRNMKDAEFPSSFNKCRNCRLKEQCFEK